MTMWTNTGVWVGGTTVPKGKVVVEGQEAFSSAAVDNSWGDIDKTVGVTQLSDRVNAELRQSSKSRISWVKSHIFHQPE